jgi:hypothetical protein
VAYRERSLQQWSSSSVLLAFCANMIDGSSVKSIERLSSFVSRHTSEMRTSTGIISASYSESKFSKLTDCRSQRWIGGDIDQCLPKEPRRNNDTIKRSSSLLSNVSVR